MPLSEEQTRRLKDLYLMPSKPGSLRGIKGLQDIARRHVGVIGIDEAKAPLSSTPPTVQTNQEHPSEMTDDPDWSRGQ